MVRVSSLAILLGSVFAAQAIAATDLSTSQSSAPQPKPSAFWYGGVDLGSAYYDNGGNPLAHHTQYQDFAAGLHLGYQFNRYFSAEFGYQDLGEAQAHYDYGSMVGEFQQGLFVGRFQYPLSQTWTPYATLGGSLWQGQVTGFDESNTDQGVSLVYGLGVRYQFGRDWSLRLDYQQTTDMGSSKLFYTDHHLVSFGISKQFAHAPTLTAQGEPTVIIVEHETFDPSPKDDRWAMLAQDKFVFNSFNTESLFAHNSSYISNPHLLSTVIGLLRAHGDLHIEITGHTDSTGSQEYNDWLSSRRAQRVQDYLIAQGIDGTRLTFAGIGARLPIADNATEQGRAMNRRVELLLHFGERVE